MMSDICDCITFCTPNYFTVKGIEGGKLRVVNIWDMLILFNKSYTVGVGGGRSLYVRYFYLCRIR